MVEKKTLLEVLLEGLSSSYPKLTEDLVTRIFKVEERVQFDGERGDVTSKIKEIVQAHVDKTTMIKG